MNCAIDGIQVQNFRGIRRLHLPVDGRNLIIVGENGSGKSSIVDAIEYFFTGQIAPLEGRGDVNKRLSIPHLQGGATEVSLTLRGVSPAKGVPLPYPGRTAAIPDSLEPLLDLAARRAFILRRSQILRFINARDAERYEEISQLIGLGRLDRMDDSWRRERNMAQRRSDQLRGDCQDILDRLGELLHTEVRRETDIVRAVNAQLAVLELQPIVRREDLTSRQEMAKQRTGIGAAAPAAVNLASLRETAEQIAGGVEEISFQYQVLHQSVKEFWDQSDSLQDASLEPLLAEGQRILRGEQEISNCPLCEEPIRDRAKLLRRLGERLGDLRELTQIRTRIGELERVLEENLLLLHGSLGTLGEGLKAHGWATYLPTLQAAQDEVHRQRRWLSRPDRRPGEIDQSPRTAAIGGLLQILPELKARIVQREKALTPTEGEQRILDWLVRIAQIDEQWRLFQRKARELARAWRVSRQISLVHDELVAARKRGLERLRQELEEDFDRLYQQLHPDEGYEAISIPVQHGQRSSVALRARFQDQEESHPLSYYSEGHLDSLGLCIFLAFIKRFNQDLKLIVLDDVLTTVDAGHRLRVARLLAREFSDYQLVITTHDQLWANELTSTLPNPKLVQLRKWTLGQGVDYQDNVLSDWDYYARQAEQGRPQDTIGGAGRNLEKFLYQMRSNLGLAIPAKPDRVYTIGDLYGPFWSWVNKHQPERPDRPEFARELRELNRELDEVWRLRNWSGAHFNAWAETVTPEEALAFLYAIERLVTSFECPVCQNLAVYRRAARALICPRCQPCPPPQAICEYKPGWHAASARLLQATEPTIRRHAVGMARAVCRAFLRDTRRRLNYPVRATPDDQYDLSELYSPFFKWATTHPRDGVSGWEQTITERKQALDAYRQEGEWADVADAKIESFVDAVRQLTALFECCDCSQLLSYDRDQETYFCAECDERSMLPFKVPAYWFVRKD